MANNERYDNSKFNTIFREQGRRQDWLARRLGVSRSYISHLKRGAAPITPAMARRIAVVLEVPVTDLLPDDDPVTCSQGVTRDR